MENNSDTLSKYLVPFEAEKSAQFYYLTLFQDNSTLKTNLFHPDNADLEPNKDQLLDCFDQFFAIYSKTFSGDEREQVPMILERILPSSYRFALSEAGGRFPNTGRAIYERNSDKSASGSSNDSSNEIRSGRLLGDIEKNRRNRIKKDKLRGSQNDQTIITFCLTQDEGKFKVIGGMILEYYASRSIPIEKDPISHCILTYLFFDEDYRRKGLGTYFIKKILPRITFHQISVQGRKVQPSYVFFETENPIYADHVKVKSKELNEASGKNGVVGLGDDDEEEEADGESKCKSKLEFFKNVGAKWLDICYVQPKLSKDQARSYNLLLMIFPEFSTKLTNPFIINKKHVRSFLDDFYTNLEDEIADFDESPDTTSTRNNDRLPDAKIVDADLRRSRLAIEVSDAIDDYENRLEYDKVVELRSLQKDLENQLDFIADLTKGKKGWQAEVIVCALDSIFLAKSEQNGEFETACKKCVASNDKIVKRTSQNEINNVIEGIVQKYNELVFGNEGGLTVSGASSVKRSRMLRSLHEIEKDFKRIVGVDSLEDFQTNGMFYLKEVPKFESPKLQFDKSSIAYHIALNPDVDSRYLSVESFDSQATTYEFTKRAEPANWKVPNQNLLHLSSNGKRILTFQDIDCPIFKSYENDLLAFNYYEEKSRTRNKFLTSFSVDVTFPYKMEYLSEGRKECLFLDVAPDGNAQRIDDSEKKYFNYKKRLNGFLNVKYFKDDIPTELVGAYEKAVKTVAFPLDPDIGDIIADYEVANAKSLVWSVVFTNSRDSQYRRIPLSEYEIIALAKQFSGKQERSYVELKFDNLEVKSDDYEQLTARLFSIIDSKLKRETGMLYDIHSGIIQTDTLDTQIFSNDAKAFVPLFLPKRSNKQKKSKVPAELSAHEAYQERVAKRRRIDDLLEEYLKDNVDNIDLQDKLYPESESDDEEPISHLEIYRSVRDFHYDDTFTGFEDRYEENTFLKYFFNALCGISLGIFDFHRMGYEEVTDTIMPMKESATDKAMIIMKRASIFSCCHDNSVFESSIDTIGMSPYLIIPNAVLVYNRLLADHYNEFQKNLMRLVEDDIKNEDYLKLRKDAQKDLNVKSRDLYLILLRLRRKTESYCDNIFIPNIFNYPTEQEIYKEGSADRGINELYSNIKSTKEELDESIDNVVDIRNNIYNMLIAIFVGVLSLTGAYEFFHALGSAKELAFLSDLLPYKSWIGLGDLIFAFPFLLLISYFGTRLYFILPRYIKLDLRSYFWKYVLLFIVGFFLIQLFLLIYCMSNSW